MKRKIAATLGALGLVMAMSGVAFAVTYATVDGHEAFSNDANSPDYWGEDCTKFNAGEGDLGLEQNSYELTADYGKVIVKSGSGEFANTIFEDVTAGETVWADTNGNNTFDPKDGENPDGDQNISHIIFCDEGPSQSQLPETNPPTGAPSQDINDITESPTDGLFGNGTSSPADGAWLLVVALGALLASVVVLTPARAKSRR